MMGTERTPKELLRVVKSTKSMVGDGFEIRRPMPGPGIEGIDPFLLLDHAGPTRVEPSDIQRGVDEHPHKGFETVTVVLQGELEHRDSAGNHGRLKEGDVQWMTAAAGVVHEEKHGKEFTKRGGTIEMIQLWVNLPARFKGETPGYQDIPSTTIPIVTLENEAGSVRVVAGSFQGVEGPARTFTPIALYDITLSKGGKIEIPRPDGETTGLYVIQGGVRFNGQEIGREGELAGFGVDGSYVTLEGEEDSRILLIGGEPIDEPVVSYGPFVMNTMDEIREAFAEFRSGKMGTIAA